MIIKQPSQIISSISGVMENYLFKKHPREYRAHYFAYFWGSPQSCLAVINAMVNLCTWTSRNNPKAGLCGTTNYSVSSILPRGMAKTSKQQLECNINEATC